MAIDQDLSALALRNLFAWEVLRPPAVQPPRQENVTDDPLTHRLASLGDRFTTALRRALALTWKTLELALANGFVHGLPLPEGRAAPIGLFAAALVERVDKLDPLTRERCFFGLRNCRNRDLLDNGVIAFPALVGLLRDFAMAERQGSAASADREVGARVGSTIRAAGYPDLGALLAPRGPGDARLAGILAEILRGYFLVEVAKDAELSAGFLCANRERRTRTAGRKRTRATWRGTTRPSARRS